MSDLPFSPSEVLNLLGYESSDKASVYITCPNCGRKKKLNIVLYGEKAHLCRCNVCNWRGNSVSLYREITKAEKPYKEIMERLGRGEDKAPKDFSYREEKHITSSIASIEARNSVFGNMLLSGLKLEESDKNELIRRGLSEEYITRHFYRSIYLPTFDDAKALTKSLEKLGCTLKGVQGFYKHKNQWTCVRVRHRGIVVPYMDRHGMCQGFQIRKRNHSIYFVDANGSLVGKEFANSHDTVTPPKAPHLSGYEFVKWSSDLTDITENKVVYPIYRSMTDKSLYPKKLKLSEDVKAEITELDDNRYYWFSSRDYEEGVGSPCFVHYATDFILNPQSRKRNAVLKDTLYITEGGLKADIFHYFTKLPCLAISGVNCQEELMKELEAYKKIVKKVVVAFDMDYLTNQYVVNAEAELKKKITDMGYEYFRLTWDEKYKGIDDYCLSNKGRFKINYTADKSVLTCVSKE